MTATLPLSTALHLIHLLALYLTMFIMCLLEF